MVYRGVTCPGVYKKALLWQKHHHSVSWKQGRASTKIMGKWLYFVFRKYPKKWNALLKSWKEHCWSLLMLFTPFALKGIEHLQSFLKPKTIWLLYWKPCFLNFIFHYNIPVILVKWNGQLCLIFTSFVNKHSDIDLLHPF